MGERLQPLGRGLLPALAALQARSGAHFLDQVAVLMASHPAALILLRTCCSFILDGIITATPIGLRSLAAGLAAILPAAAPLLQAVREQSEKARDPRLLKGFVMTHCNALRRIAFCFLQARGGEAWPLLAASALPPAAFLPWVRELVACVEVTSQTEGGQGQGVWQGHVPTAHLCGAFIDSPTSFATSRGGPCAPAGHAEPPGVLSHGAAASTR